MDLFIDDLLALFVILFWWPVVMLCALLFCAAVLDAVLQAAMLIKGGSIEKTFNDRLTD